MDGCEAVSEVFVLSHEVAHDSARKRLPILSELKNRGERRNIQEGGQIRQALAGNGASFRRLTASRRPQTPISKKPTSVMATAAAVSAAITDFSATAISGCLGLAEITAIAGPMGTIGPGIPITAGKEIET